MAAKDVVHGVVARWRGAGPIQAQRGHGGAGDITPPAGRIGAGVHQQGAAAARRQWHAAQKGAFGGAELRPRPRHPGVGHWRGLGDVDVGEMVVVALHGQRASGHQAHRALHHLRGKGAIANQIAQQGVLLRARRFGMRQAGIESVQIGVNVGKQGEFHRARTPSVKGGNVILRPRGTRDCQQAPMRARG